MKNQFTRRKFIKTAAVGAIGIAAFPQFFASCRQIKSTVDNSNGIIRLGFIGLGRQCPC